MIEESKALLHAMGIPIVEAPSEGEAQAAYMVKEGLAYAAVSQDYDALLFGSTILLRNLSIGGKRKVPRENRFVLVEPEEVRLEETLGSLGIGREQLILIGILIGSDFNKGIKGVGPKTALKIVKEHKTLDAVRRYAEAKYTCSFEEYIEEVYDFFLHPPVKALSEKLVWKEPDKETVQRILCTEHDFSEDRVRRVLDGITGEYKEKSSQHRLDEWA